MYGGLMDPDMLRLAQDQMSRLRPEDLQRMQQQMMSNPDLFRMASESIKNMRPEDLRLAADQMKNMQPDQMAEIRERMSRTSPEEIAGFTARGGAATKQYEYQGALALKNQGNGLHGAGKYSEAAEKYSKAKDNLSGHTSPDAKSLRLTCSLNLMSCFLKTKQFQQAVTEGSDVLQSDPDNLKALYRRGQAYKELGKFQQAIHDLRRATELSPDDDTIADVLRQTEKELEGQETEVMSRDGPIIEEITDEEAERFTSNAHSRAAESTGADLDNGERESRRRGDDSTTNNYGPSTVDDRNFSETFNVLKQNPEMIRSMHSMMSTLNPEHVAELSGGGISPEMAKMTADMMKQMSPDELQRMIEMAGSLRGQEGSSRGYSGFEPRSRPPSSSAPPSVPLQSAPVSESSIVPEPQPSQRPESSHPLAMPEMNGDMQEQLRKQMKDPAMKQMMSTMMKSMTPDMMASMSEQLGIKLSPEEAAQAQKAMSSLSPDELDRLMRWAERAQRLAEQAKRVKNWLVQRPGLVLAVLLLLVAMILHYFGVIGE